MERLTILVVLGVLVSCTPRGQAEFRSWDEDFALAPSRFGAAVTALWISSYQEDAQTHRFVRTRAWGEVPEKLIPDGRGGFTAALPVLLQTETSDGPVPDRFVIVLVRVQKAGDEFTMAPNDALPGTVIGWHEADRRTLWFRGRTAETGSSRTLWQFQGRY